MICEHGSLKRSCSICILQEENIHLELQNKILKQFISELSDRILSELEKDGWCRLVIEKDKAIEMKDFVNSLR